MQRSAVLRWRPLVQVSSRKVLQAVLERHGVPPELFGPVCVVVDKIEKIKAERVPPPPRFLPDMQVLEVITSILNQRSDI